MGTRRNPEQKYIMAGKTYICGLSKAKHPYYEEILMQVFESCQELRATSKAEAIELLKKLMKVNVDPEDFC